MSERLETRGCAKCGAPLGPNALGSVCPKCLSPLAFGPAETSPSPVGGELAAAPLAEAAAIPAQPAPRRAGIPGIEGYEVLEEIGRGGMGVVFKARQTRLNRLVAVKTILAGALAGKVEAQRLRVEAEAAAQLQHPNIVAIHEIGEGEGIPYFSMEYVEGKSLAEVVSGRPLEPTRAAAYLRTIATAIEYAHRQGMLHRDLKPSNVLIDRFDQPRITDFGLVKRLDNSQLSTPDPQLTVTGQVLGTPGFMPPEQAGAKDGAVGPASDVYSLGALLYYLLTGRPPFAGNSLAETLTLVLGAEPMPPRKLNPKVPRDLEIICLKCLAKDSRRRYATAQELADELDRFLREVPILARPAGRAERTWRWCRRYPALASLAISLTITVGAVLGLLAVLAQRRGSAGGGTKASEANGDRTVLTELWAVDGATFTIGTNSIGPGRDIGVDLTNGNYWGALLESTTVTPAGVIIREGAQDQTLESFRLGGTNNFCPGSVRVDAVHRIAWVSAQCGHGNDPIWAVHADSHAVIRAIRLGGVNGGTPTVNPLTGRYYQDSSGAKRVDTNTFISKPTAFGPVLGVNTSSGLMYARGPEGWLQIVNGTPDPEIILTNVPLGFPFAPGPIGIDSDHDRIYLGNAASNQIYILDGRTGQNRGTIVLDKQFAFVQRLYGIVYDAAHERVYALAYDPRQHLSYLFLIDHGQQHAIRVPAEAGGPVLNPMFNKIYIWAGPGSVH